MARGGERTQDPPNSARRRPWLPEGGGSIEGNRDTLAWLRGGDYLSPALVQEIAPDVLRHRIGLTYEAEAEEITPDKIVAQVLERTPVPAK